LRNSNFSCSYLFNPFTIVSCVGKSTILLQNLAILCSIFFGLKGLSYLSVFSLSIASYLSIYPVILLLPLWRLFPRKESLVFVVTMFVGFFGGLLYLSYALLHSWSYFFETYEFALFLKDLSPNIGLFWYFFMEVFKHFEQFYLFVYQYHVFVYTVPLYFRFREHSMFLLWVNMSIMAIFKSYPSVGDIALQMAFIPLISSRIKGTRYGIIVPIATIFASVLLPIFWSMWIYKGTGNSNFYYAITLVFTLGQVFFIVDAVSSVLKQDYLSKKQSKEHSDQKILIDNSSQ